MTISPERLQQQQRKQQNEKKLTQYKDNSKNIQNVKCTSQCRPMAINFVLKILNHEEK